MPVSEATYRRLVLEDPDSKWELICGYLRRKPAMRFEHYQTAIELAFMLREHLGLRDYLIRVDAGRVRRAGPRYFIPDVYVAAMDSVLRQFPEPGMLEAYPEPLLLVVEVWSPSTAGYDVTERLREYQARGDREVWLLHPYERTLTRWVQQAGGSYTERHQQGGIVTPASLPAVHIDLDALFSMVRPEPRDRE